MKKKLNFKVVAVCYCSLLVLLIVLTSLPYGESQSKNKPMPIDFSSGWSVVVDGNQLTTGVTLPYEVKNTDIHDIELRNTIPSYPFQAAVMETVIFQKDIQVYIDGSLVMDQVFERKSFNQTSPGSGRVFIPLSPDSQGKEIVIKLHKVVSNDNGPIAKISILDGLMSDSSIVSLSSSAFLATVLMLFIGVCLLITCLAYIPSGIKIYPMASMAMFVISASLWVLCNSKSLQYFTDNWVLTHNLEYISFYTTPLWLWMFLSYNWVSHKKLCDRATNIFIAFVMITLTAKAFGICDFYVFLKLFHIIAIINIVIILVLGLKDIKNQPNALKLFFLGIAGLCFTSLIDLFRYYTIFSPDAMAFFFISGIIFMGICLFLTFILMTKEKVTRVIEDNIYKELAFTDILTGLNSRAKWDADIALIESKINSYESVLTAMIDVNDLKKVNDQFGHHEGDVMLTKVSDALKNRFKDIGRCYRLGGDEFCVIMIDRPLSDMKTTLSLVCEDLSGCSTAYPVSFSWGCAKYNRELHNNLSDTLKEADNFMYEYKRKNKLQNTSKS